MNVLRVRAFLAAVFLSAMLQACGSDTDAVFFPDLDEPDASFDASLDGSSGDSTTDDASSDSPSDGSPEPETCKASSDCSLPAHPCLLPLCERGLCTTIPAPAGTYVPDSAQTPGDCKRLECGEAGEFVFKAEPSDIPEDDNECTEKACEGPNPVFSPMGFGTPCGTDGVCNGSGVCGVCSPGALQCSGNVPQECDSNGQWTNRSPCPFACSAGACTGACSPGSKQCNGRIPQTCSASGQWQNGATCTYVCVSGDCDGVCTTGSRRCSGSVTQLCDANGQWRDDATCPFVCSAGSCTGTCSPGSTRCSGRVPQTCNAAGAWESGTTCPYVCSDGRCITSECVPGEGKCEGVKPWICDSGGNWEEKAVCPYLCNSGTCAGVCTPATKRCNGQIPQTCTAAGAWEGATACTASACISGACVGSCVPGTKRCSGQEAQICDASGEWQSSQLCPYACSGAGVCTGSCVSGTKRCNGKSPQLCDASGQWIGNGSACTNACFQGVCLDHPLSCNSGTGDGLSTCGASGAESCCESLPIPAGTFYRGYDGVFSSDMSYPATVSGFELEKYEVTVARFRKFVTALAEGYRPATGSGKHAHLSGGGGLNGTEAGWQTAWNTYLPAQSSAWDSSSLLACSPNATWTPSPGANERRPINCVSWHQAYAFCIWDGGFLPSEAEWHYAASGGPNQRVYPWSSPSTSTTVDYTFASYACMGDGISTCSLADLVFGGTKPKGLGFYGHADLGGNAFEWVLDHFTASYATTSCSDCASLSTDTTSPRVIRGGSWREGDTCSLRAAERRSWGVLARSDGIGFRCAYAP